jgi:Tol biopolymer transport system component
MRTAILGLVTVALSVGGNAAQGQARPVAPDPGERYFASLQQLTFGGQNAEAYFAPDGRRLIFQRTETDSTCDQQYTMNLDGTGLRRVSSGLGRTTCGYFYGAGRIFYASTVAAGPKCPPRPDYSQGYVWGLFEYDIYAAREDGSDVQRLTATPGYDAEGTLSPDGKRIVFTSERDGDLDIYSMNLDGSDVRRLTNTLGYDGGPFYSHDGKLIVYRASHPQSPAEQAEYRGLLARHLVRPTQMELWVMNADGSQQRQVTHMGGASFAPYLHPDGRRIIFGSNYTHPTSRNFDLYLINLDGTGLAQVTTDTTFDSFPMFSPDGKRLVFASNRNGKAGETNIFVADWVERRR